jgi:osmoprotectant transport system substrate-binding protein
MGGFVGARSARLAAAMALVALAGCSSGGQATPRPAPGTIVVGSFDFPESEVLAAVYGQALRATGLPVRLHLDLGPRELVEPALQRGLLHLVPEYQGSALDFLTAAANATSDPVATHRALARALAGTDVQALASSVAQDANAFAVTAATADRYGLRSIADLGPLAPKLVFGGPAECPERPLCLRGLQDVYSLRFGSFVPLDTGGPITIGALAGGDVDVALVFSTDPSVAAHGFRLLTDDRGLEPAENVTPVVSRALVRRYGDRLTGTLDRISATLTTADLIAMNQAVAAGRRPAAVARAWLDSLGSPSGTGS